MGSAGITIDVLNDCMAVAGKGYTAHSRGSFLENRIQKLILISRYVKTSEVAKPIFETIKSVLVIKASKCKQQTISNIEEPYLTYNAMYGNTG